MATTVQFGYLDSLLGLTFGYGALANVAATQIRGSITNNAASTSEVLTYEGLTATIGSLFIAMKSVTFTVKAISDIDNTLTIDAYVGTMMVGEMNFSVAGFSPAGIVLAAMPLDALVSQTGGLSALAGSLFVLGIGAAGAKAQTVAFHIGNAYSFILDATVHYATAGHPVLQAGRGPQILIALSGNDTITAGPGRAVIYGGPGNDVLTGGAGNTMIYGGAGTDTIIGGSGMATLTAGSGTDTIIAGTGRTIMIGGDGMDKFVFAPGHTGGLTPATADAIQRFRPWLGDVIDLSAFGAVLPADSTGHLSFIGTAAFDNHAGELRYDVTSSGIALQCDLTGSGTAEVLITMKNITSIAASSFLL